MGIRTTEDRTRIVNEIKFNLMSLDIQNELTMRILFAMLHNYINNGTTYIKKELTINTQNNIQQVFLINLFNDTSKTDTVIISKRVILPPKHTRVLTQP